MTSISNLLSNFTNETSKSINDHAREYKEKKKYSNNETPALTQGEKFKHYQKKIKKNLEKQTKNFKYFNEGFQSGIEQNLRLTADGLTAQTNNVIQNNDYSSQQSTIHNLRNQYESTLLEYENLVAKISGNTSGYLDRVNPNNPYLGKNIVFTTGESAYVTKLGVVKLYPRDGWVAWYTMGKNGCPSGAETPINLPWLAKYNTPGATIPSKPPLVTGTPMTTGQSCGNEGVNVFVDKMINNPTITFNSCSVDNPTSPLMTFIGGAPPPPSASLQNGNFEQPQIANNSYQYIDSFTTVPGWYFSAVLINNSSAWGYPMPYPKGSQAACVQAQQRLAQWLFLSSGTYTISFYACGRPGYMGGNQVNVIQDYWSEVIYTFTPSITAWQKYTVTVNLPQSKVYAFGFQGLNPSGNYSTAIQGIQINRSSGGSSGSYTYDQCKEVAIDAGYQFFALQGVNTSTSKGYCAVSNDQPRITSLGASIIQTSSTPLWSSNTSGQTGNTATLSITGSLSVVNSGGQSVFSTPNRSSQSSNYVGCYTDSPNRAMDYTVLSNGTVGNPNGPYNWGMNVDSCRQTATNSNFKYYAIQAGSVCFLSNDINKTKKYGVAGNCSGSGGNIVGGGWSNSVYSVEQKLNYFLILQDDGNLVIYKGSGPNDNQGAIWSTGTNGKQKDANPTYAAAKGKYGKNWIAQGSVLAAGDFIGSTNGNMALVMQSDGNLVLYTFSMGTNCQKMQDGNTGGGVGANAIYNIGAVGNQSNLSKVGYIDQNAELHSYPSTNTKYTNSYTKLPGNDSAGNDIPGANYGNATPVSCQNTCNAIQECAGFAFAKNSNICFPKNSGMYPTGNKTLNPNVDLYTRSKTPISTPIGVPKTTNNIDSITWKNYKNGGEVSSSYGLANANAAQKAQLEQLQNRLNLLSSQLSSYTNEFGQGSQDAVAQSQTNVTGLTDYVNGLKNTTDKITGITRDGNINNILKDSDIVVLQKNYDYLFWSILATGSVLVAMNIVKQ